MKLSKVLSIVAIVSILVTGVAVATRNLGGITATEVTATELQDTRSAAAPVQVAPVTTGPVQTALSYSGSVITQDTVNILPKVSGRLLELAVDLGDTVKKGDIIARIDTDQPTAQLLQAYASLYSARAKLAQMQEGSRSEQINQSAAGLANAQAKLDSLKRPLDQNQVDMAKAGEVAARAALQQAQTNYDKIAWFDGKGALPQSLALQQATTAYESARASYLEQLAGTKDEDIRAQEAIVQQSQAALALVKVPFRDTDFQLAQAAVLQSQAVVYGAQLQLKECTIYAPLDGSISSAPVAVGAIVGPSTPVVTMVSSAVEVDVKVEEARIGQISVGQPVTLTVAAYPGQSFGGTVSRISPTADPTDRTFLVRIVPTQQNGQLKGGMFSDAQLIVEQHADALLVPRTAVVSEADRSYVMVVTGGQVERREVELGLARGEQVQIRAGLVLGEQVVSAGQKGLKPGDLVRVVAQG
jgi:HlyD family secretion protein